MVSQHFSATMILGYKILETFLFKNYKTTERNDGFEDWGISMSK